MQTPSCQYYCTSARAENSYCPRRPRPDAGTYSFCACILLVTGPVGAYCFASDAVPVAGKATPTCQAYQRSFSACLGRLTGVNDLVAVPMITCKCSLATAKSSPTGLNFLSTAAEAADDTMHDGVLTTGHQADRALHTYTSIQMLSTWSKGMKRVL